jgi:tRNA threonylcarbamoyladenosine biosynthesis protein TsaE
MKKLIREWKKVYEEDLGYIIFELKESLATPALLILSGELGAGKTTFCKRFVGEDQTLSPTYSILSETESLLHADFYRIKQAEEFYHLELDLYLEGKSYFFAEWGERYLVTLGKILPESYSSYMMEIKVNETSDKGRPASRNFQLFEINLYD